MTETWLPRVPPQPEELFSTWLVRAAIRLGCDPSMLTNALWPRYRAWIRDLDLGIPPAHLELLSRASGVPESTLSGMLLLDTAQALGVGGTPTRGQQPWIISFGHRNVRRKRGLQYCPQCLVTDPQPFFRRQWRLAWHTHCPHHQRLLHDTCPECQLPVLPYRLSAASAHAAICFKCGTDLRLLAPSAASNHDALQLQAHAQDVLERGFGEHTDFILPTRHWFWLIKGLVSIIRSSNKGRDSPLRAFLKDFCIDVDPFAPNVAHLPLETWPTEQRAMLLGAAWQVYSTPVEEICLQARRHRIGACCPPEFSKHMPAEITALYPELFTFRSPSRRAPRRFSKTTTTRAAVERAWAQLQRIAILRAQ